MLWLGLVGALVALLVVALIAFTRRPGHDLGALSTRWVEQHRLEL